jgi:hypothetical protein
MNRISTEREAAVDSEIYRQPWVNHFRAMKRGIIEAALTDRQTVSQDLLEAFDLVDKIIWRDCEARLIAAGRLAPRPEPRAPAALPPVTVAPPLSTRPGPAPSVRPAPALSARPAPPADCCRPALADCSHAAPPSLPARRPPAWTNL